MKGGAAPSSSRRARLPTQGRARKFCSRRHSGMVRRTRPQMCDCTSGNLEIPGSMLTHRPGMTETISRFTMTRLVTSLALALAGLVLFGQGAYIHAKALLAQVLLERAFSETIASGREVKP